MVEINLVGDKNNNTGKFVFKDNSVFAGAGIAVDDDAYDVGGFADRDYDVRGHNGVSISTQNIGANSVDVLILGSTKDFTFNQLDAGLNDGDFTEELVAEAAVAAAVKASQTLTCVSAVATNTVTVNGLIYTAVNGVKTDNTEFSVDTGDNETAADLADSINNDVRVGVTSSVAYTAVAATNVVTVTADNYGAGGNIVDTSTTGGTITAGNTTLLGGVDGASAPYTLVRDTPNITAIRIRAKETADGSPGTLRGDVKAF
jgi:hypothetical protein